MRLSRVLLRKWTAPANIFMDQTLTGKPIRNLGKFEHDKAKLGARLIREAGKQLQTETDHAGFWENYKRRPELIQCKITPFNFENKFVDLIYDTGLNADPLVLRSLKELFEAKCLDRNPVQKSAYGQLLLMLSKLEINGGEYEDKIEQIYTDLRTAGFLAKEVCINFTLTYARHSVERFWRVSTDLNLTDKSCANQIRSVKRVEMMEIAFDYAAYDPYFVMLQTLEYSDNIVLQQFRNKSDRVRDLDTYLRLLRAVNDAQATLCTSDVGRVSNALRRLGQYWGTMIKPKTVNCPNCGEQMPGLTDEEIERLRVYFLDCTIKQASNGRNENELMKKYISWLRREANQLDLVIDGLNLGFQGFLNIDIGASEHAKGGVHLRTDAKSLELNLINLINSTVKGGDYKNILFIARFSYFKYEKLNKLLKQNNIEVRYFQRYIEDDLPAILAALYNRNCRIMTNDFYDDHHHGIMDPQLKKLFRKFINSRRVTMARLNNFLNYYNEGWTKQMHYNPETQNIHVPFDSENILFKRLFSWQCFKKLPS